MVFSHGWPLSADAWDDQMLFLAAHGYRVLAHDQIVPIGASAHVSPELIGRAILKVYTGARHGFAETHRDRLTADLRDLFRT